jgi:hypothetical protein
LHASHQNKLFKITHVLADFLLPTIVKRGREEQVELTNYFFPSLLFLSLPFASDNYMDLWREQLEPKR